MADRKTVGIFVATRTGDAMLYAHESLCLTTARDLSRVVGDGTISIVGDEESEEWTWRAAPRQRARKG